MDVVIATWQAGGGTQPAIGLGRLLAGRGHRVRIVAPAAYAERVAAAGCLHRPLPAAAEFDPALGRRMEDQGAFMRRLFFGPELPEAVADELASDPADVLVADYLLRALVCRAELLPVATALLVHTLYRFHGGAGDDETTRARRYEPVDAIRAGLGLEPLPPGPDSVTVALARGAAAALVVLPREFDDWPEPPPNVVHVGPIVEESGDTAWERPWPAADRRPLVVVSMGTTYMGHEGVLGRVAEALDGLGARVLVLTGAELAPAEVAARPGVEVRGYVPHAAVLPGAALVVTHAGTGTLLASFAAGVPVVCLPLGRDQSGNAQRVEELGLGVALPAEATVPEIRAAVAGALAAAPLREAAGRMAGAIGGYGAGARAVEAVERLRA